MRYSIIAYVVHTANKGGLNAAIGLLAWQELWKRRRMYTLDMYILKMGFVVLFIFTMNPTTCSHAL